MLSDIKINNFKCLDDLELNEINNLTVLTGPNNSGKSSIMEAIIFLKNCITDGGIDWDSDDVSLKNFSETVYNHNRNNEIVISCTFAGNYEIFGQPFEKIKFKTNIDLGGIPNQEILTFDNIPILTLKNKNLILHKSAFNAGDDLQLEYSYNSDVPICYRLDSNVYDETVDELTILIKDLFDNIYYLSPHRAGDQWDYSLEEESTYVRSNGDNVASLLHYKFSDRDKLFDRLESWIKDFDNNITLIKSPLKSRRTHIKLDIKNTSVNLFATGTGLNTVFPIVMSCVFSPKNSIILIEEPEIHLHTKALKNLLDLFLEQSQSNKQIIFTTHSWDIHRDIFGRISKKKLSQKNITRFDLKNENGMTTVETIDLKLGFQKFIDDLKELLG